MPDAIREAITAYFHGEKMAGAMVVPIGLAFAACGAWVFLRGAEWRTTAWPLWVGALVQIGIGVVLYLRSDGQAQALLDHADRLGAETQRLVGVVRTFTILKVVWCVLIAASAAAPYLIHKAWVRPVAVGIIANAALVLLFDIVADARARVYLTALESND
jgi:hypothetical protein